MLEIFIQKQTTKKNLKREKNETKNEIISFSNSLIVKKQKKLQNQM